MAIAQDTILVFAGGRDLSVGGGDPLDALGDGGPGSFSVSGTQDFVNTVFGRGQAGRLKDKPLQDDFAIWGGAVAFDTKAKWYFGLPPDGLDNSHFDFLSVAEHELSHLLGFGTARWWENQVQNLPVNNVLTGVFTGPTAKPSLAPRPESASSCRSRSTC